MARAPTGPVFEKTVIRSGDGVGSLPSLKDPPGRKQQQNSQQARSSGKKSRNSAEEPKIAASRFSAKLLLVHRKVKNNLIFKICRENFRKIEKKTEKIHNTSEIEKKRFQTKTEILSRYINNL